MNNPLRFSRFRTMKSYVGMFGVVLGLLVSTITLTFFLLNEPALLSPISAETSFRFLDTKTIPSSNKVVYGFLPYWNINKTSLHPTLTHLAYFGLTVGGDGSLLTNETDEASLGYTRFRSDTLLQLTSTAQQQGTRFDLVLIQFNNEDIRAFAGSPAAHQRLLEQLDAVLLAYPIHGINIDFEYSGEVTPKLRQDFADFVDTISQHLDTKYQGVELSIDIYASAANNKQIWDIPRIGQAVDYVIVMAYDFHQRSSPQAGPVAPLFGGKEYWTSDISQNLQLLIDQMPREKILLGVPFYGYGWQTTGREPQAATYPGTGFTASYDLVQELLAEADDISLEEHWNDDALSPYISYQEGGLTYVIYYENSRSLSYKLDFVNQLDLGGMAIWALGYEGDSPELWEVVERKVVRP